MEMTDILYGVVMAELGVSSIVPVSFQEAEKVLENKTPS
jgi:chromosome segregation ATPase